MNRIALVTGASRGIGQSIAARLTADGFTVRTLARQDADLSDRAAVKRFCARWQGPLHVLVNNAAVCHVKRLDAPADDDAYWDQVLDTNLGAVHFLTRGLLPHLPDGARIVNISSQLGQEGRAGYGAYCASKFGLIGLTKVWAKELGARQITVNAVCPGWVRTAQAAADMERLAREKKMPVEQLYRDICEPLELKRFTEPEEVASLVGFLISPAASGVTGRDWLMNTVWNQT